MVQTDLVSTSWRIPITIWMNMPSFYQIDLFRTLMATGIVDLRVIYASPLPAYRRNLGWSDELGSGCETHYLDPQNPMLDAMLIAWKQRKRVHIMSGIWAEKPFTAALAVLRSACSHYFVYSEPPIPFVRRSRAKQILRKVMGFALLKTQRVGLLAVSHAAREFYSSYGLSPERIYDFGYFRAGDADLVRMYSDRPVRRVIYVGQLTRRKRVDLLLDAVAPLLGRDLLLDIYGDGEERPQLELRTQELGLQDFVVFRGVIASSDILAVMAQSDVLVLPSDFDGWGMVINEALLVGTPVIVSDACGAADVIHAEQNGFIFPRGNAMLLREALHTWLNSDQVALRTEAYKTGQTLLPEIASAYVVECIQHKLGQRDSKPVAPWLAPL